jgi:2-C-methyl-D-erythritol 4-phosphate cytidylyltransferase
MPISTKPQIFALIPCGGTGSRAGEGLPKQYRSVAGRSVVGHTLAAFAAVPRVAGTCVVIAPDDALFAQHVKLPNATFSIAACAGNTRASTVFHGLNSLLEQGAEASDWVLVHDAARCLITPELINRLIDACFADEVGGLLALPLPDTLKSSSDDRVQATVDRAGKWLAQTPQMFRIGDLIAGQQMADASQISVTDESSLMELQGKQPKLVQGSAQNFKVTYPEDFELAQALLLARSS